MSLAAWRDLSIILLVIQTLFMVLAVGALLYLLNRGMAKVRRAVKRYAPTVQEQLWRISHISRQVSDKFAAPVIRAETASAQTRRWVGVLRAAVRH